MDPSTDIIYYTLFPWDHHYSSVSLSFTRAFAKHNRVFYINHAYTWKDFITKYQAPNIKKRRSKLWAGKMAYDQVSGISDKVTFIHPPNTIPINFLPPGGMYRLGHRLNHRHLLKTVQKVIDDYNLKDFIYLNCFNPFHGATLPKSMGVKYNIYQCIDDMAEEPYTAKHAVKLEEQVIKEADITLVTSSNLHQLKSPLNPHTHVLHNAMDWNIFQRATTEVFPRPKEIATIKTPIIGFTGNISESRIDYPLLKKMATLHRDKTLVMVGPLNSNDYKEIGLDRLPNVIFTGAKDITALPNYLQHFDCAIIPNLCNKLTASIYPLKINEYLAAGKPVVSTKFSRDIQGFGDHIFLADHHEGFLQAIDRAISTDNPTLQEARIEIAKQNTWEARVAQFWEIVHNFDKQKSR